VDEPKTYVKSRDTDTAGQRHNQTVFAAELRARPGRAVLLSALCLALGITALLLPHRPGIRMWILAALAFGVALTLLVVTFRRSQTP
jgi:hypothetical protein